VADADDLSGTVLDGRYQVHEPIAQGAMGSVYRGERLHLGRAVAIKVMHQELPDELASRQRFEREAKLMALLEHPNCVSVIDFGLHDEKPFLVMDLVRGTSLIDLLEKQGQLDIARAADIIRQVLSGLAHAHELGIVHRDIKPANIMISEKAGLGQQVRILDFGLARLTESSTKLTTGIVVGTPNYMAPEQCKGSDVDARTDIYACGVMLFEMLTGRKPFVADDPIAVVRKHLMEKPPTLAAVEPRIDFGDLEAVVAKALAKSPADRFDSAVEMSKAVEVAAAKASKLSAAAVFARAVPEGVHAQSPASDQATMSGWNVPADARSSALPDPAQASGPTFGQPGASQSDQASGPSIGLPTLDGSPSGSLGSMNGGSGPVVAGNLPPLPQAGPYVPPPGAAAADDASSTGAPNRSIDIPVTRPAKQPRQLPLTTKQMMIAGSVVFGLVVVIALVARGGKSNKTTAKPPVVPGVPALVAPVSEADAKAIERAKTLIASEDFGDAVDVLDDARKASPQNAELAFLAGKANFGRLYFSDGIESFRDAIKLDSSYRDNDDLLKTVLKGFLTTPDIDDRIDDFIRRDLGSAMKPYLKETADTHPKKALRARARSELDRL
jgi:serine/threonine-protein kinase